MKIEKMKNILIHDVASSGLAHTFYLSDQYEKASESDMLDCYSCLMSYFAVKESLHLYNLSISKHNEIAINSINNFKTNIVNKSLAQKMLQKVLTEAILKFKENSRNKWDRSEAFAFQSLIVDTLSKTGKIGKQISKQISEVKETTSIHQHWKMFFQLTSGSRIVKPVFFQLLSDALFSDIIFEKYLDECNNGFKYVGLTEPVHEKYLDTFHNPDNQIDSTKTFLYLHSKTGRELAIIDNSSVDTLNEIQNKYGLFNTYTAHKLTRHILKETQKKSFKNDIDPFRLDIMGGLAHLHKILGLTKPSQKKDLLGILHAGQMLNMKIGQKYIGGLWTFTYTNENRGQGAKAYLEIVLGSSFRPHRTEFANCFVIPLLPLPPTQGHRKYWGRQCTLQQLIVGEMVQHRKDIIEYGAAYIPRDKLEILTIKSGVPVRSLDKILEKWSSNTGEGEMFTEIKPNFYRISNNPVYSESRDAIDQICKRSVQRQIQAQNAKKVRKPPRKSRSLPI